MNVSDMLSSDASQNWIVNNDPIQASVCNYNLDNQIEVKVTLNCFSAGPKVRMCIM